MKYKTAHDTLGDIKVPADKYWGAQTQRCLRNFQIGGARMPKDVIYSFGLLKKAAALTNLKLGVLDKTRAHIIASVCDEIVEGKLDEHFPLPVYQTGSGTHSNMNVNEVIASRGNEMAGRELLHPNDHVNLSQSSNDTFPTAMHMAGFFVLEDELIPNAEILRESLLKLETRYKDVIKTGRTHLQDAVPLTFGQEISGWRSMIEHSIDMLRKSSEPLREIPLGGTAVGTGLNAPEGFAERVAEEISSITGKRFITARNKFHSLTSKDGLIFAHGAVKALAANLMKIANDIRLLASGPRCGIGELRIPANEPGSSIMPGKVNPTQCEALTMACIQVMGNDVTIGIGASQGNFQLNVFMPVMIHNFLESAVLMSDGMISFKNNCIDGIKPDLERIDENMKKSLMLVTALSPRIGYENAARIAKQAHDEGITLRESAVKSGLVTAEEFDIIVDPRKMI